MVVQAELKPLLVIDTPPVEVDMAVFEDQGLGFDDMTALLSFTWRSVDKLELLLPGDSPLDRLDGEWISIAIIGCFMQIDAERGTLIGDHFLLLRR